MEMIENNFIPVEILAKNSPADMAADEIRNLVLSGKIPPGTRISSERDLAKSLGITRNAVRNSLIQLEQEGLIRQNGRGRTVAGNSADARTRKTMNNSIAIIMDEVVPVHELFKMPPSGWYSSISVGVVCEAFENGIPAIILPSNISEKTWHDNMLSITPGAVVMIGGLEDISTSEKIQDSLNLRGVPVVAYGDDHDCPGCDMILSDHQQGCRDLTSWLISRGARRILRVNDARSGRSAWASRRSDGFEEACRKAGIPILPPIEIPPAASYDFSREAFEGETHKLAGYLLKNLEGGAPVDAIMGDSDGLVTKISAALKILERDPGKIMITGYDNFWEELPDRKWEDARPAATVDKYNMGLGRELVKLAMRHFSDRPDTQPKKVMVPQRLVVLDE